MGHINIAHGYLKMLECETSMRSSKHYRDTYLCRDLRRSLCQKAKTLTIYCRCCIGRNSPLAYCDSKRLLKQYQFNLKAADGTCYDLEHRYDDPTIALNIYSNPILETGEMGSSRKCN